MNLLVVISLLVASASYSQAAVQAQGDLSVSIDLDVLASQMRTFIETSKNSIEQLRQKFNELREQAGGQIDAQLEAANSNLQKLQTELEKRQQDLEQLQNIMSEYGNNFQDMAEEGRAKLENLLKGINENEFDLEGMMQRLQQQLQGDLSGALENGSQQICDNANEILGQIKKQSGELRANMFTQLEEIEGMRDHFVNRVEEAIKNGRSQALAIQEAFTRLVKSGLVCHLVRRQFETAMQGALKLVDNLEGRRAEFLADFSRRITESMENFRTMTENVDNLLQNVETMEVNCEELQKYAEELQSQLNSVRESFEKTYENGLKYLQYVQEEFQRNASEMQGAFANIVNTNWAALSASITGSGQSGSGRFSGSFGFTG